MIELLEKLELYRLESNNPPAKQVALRASKRG